MHFKAATGGSAALADGSTDAAACTHASVANTADHGVRRVQGNHVDTSRLAESIAFPFSKQIAKNSFLKAPMTERLYHWSNEGEDISARGLPSVELIHLYKRWGEGEIGIIVAGNVMIGYDACEGYGNGVLCDNHDGRLAAYHRVGAAAKAHGSLFICQLSHPGRQVGKALNPNPVSASDVQLEAPAMGTEFAKPRALSISEIKDMVAQWAQSARLCYEADYDGVQIHCAHGYLLAQFLSKTTNKRTDAYGGSLQNRMRIVLEIIAAIRVAVPSESFMVCVKLNSVEFQAGGTTPEDCKELCIALQAARVDFIELSGGTFESLAFHHVKESTKAREAYFIEFAEMIRPHLTQTKVYVTGGFRTAAGMVRALEAEACDGIGIGRPLAAEPYLCKELLSGQVSGALENKVPAALHIPAGGTQLHQIGRGEEQISDWSDEEEVKAWTVEFEKEMRRKASVLPVVDSSGFPFHRAQKGFAYLA
ncbi:FMN-linked oxidoreductase [Myriangium duriaei CBS 260.36]|uniref:FMN-linked oxidoreductase n=1 Tax=Myriangium duriaei CBS 260.36 TaxID=1168546 RepID=A0A9P4IUU3_9PEZI|nr:FMN-linked oxidoreductase [Myriangium duriaei CBS 260.36]